MSEQLTVGQAIAEVMRRMPAIGKDSTAPGNMGGYRYRGIESITTSLQPILADVGLVIVPQAQSIVIDPAPGQKEAWQDTHVKFEWLIIGPDGSTVTASTYGVGRDHTDKGANKAQTQAFKYLLMHLLCIADSKDDVDGHDYSGSERDAPRQRTPDEQATDRLMERLTGLDDNAKPVIKGWAHGEGRTLAPAAFVADPDWRNQVTQLLDELDDGRLRIDGEAIMVVGLSDEDARRTLAERARARVDEQLAAIEANVVEGDADG